MWPQTVQRGIWVVGNLVYPATPGFDDRVLLAPPALRLRTNILLLPVFPQAFKTSPEETSHGEDFIFNK